MFNPKSQVYPLISKRAIFLPFIINSYTTTPCCPPPKAVNIKKRYHLIKILRLTTVLLSTTLWIQPQILPLSHKFAPFTLLSSSILSRQQPANLSNDSCWHCVRWYLPYPLQNNKTDVLLDWATPEPTTEGCSKVTWNMFDRSNPSRSIQCSPGSLPFHLKNRNCQLLAISILKIRLQTWETSTLKESLDRSMCCNRSNWAADMRAIS
jgi:hypothetical protein